MLVLRRAIVLMTAVSVTVGSVTAGARGELPNDGPLELPDGTKIAEVDFERHVASLFGRLGCNSAACHGSFQGKGGFRLSLFGQSPAMDHAAIVGKPETSRVNLDAPDDSLLLLKPSGHEQHGGGVRIRDDSWEYRLIRRWIAAGARRDAGRGAVSGLAVEPAEFPLMAAGETAAVRVRARFADGQEEEVTAFAEFRTRDEAVAECDAAGRIVARGPGDGAVIISYRGTFVNLPLLVPFPVVEEGASIPAANNLIDEEVNSRLAKLRLSVSPPAGDADFLRRATLDVLGTLPAPDDVRRFIADVDPAKRSKTIETLLQHPRHAALWALRMCDVTVCNVEALGAPEELRPKRARMWHDWFRKRFAANIGYDEIVRGVLCATSRREQPIESWIDDEVALEQAARASFDTNYQDRPGLDLFWRRSGPQGPVPVEDLAELTATAFLGLRLHCARCHQHPYDHWTQEDFAGYANVFARVAFGSSTELRTAMNMRLEQRRKSRQPGAPLPELPRLQEVFLSATPRPLGDSSAADGIAPKAPAGPAMIGTDPRDDLYQWLTRPGNPYFAPSFVNRLWAVYFGAGLVEPVDAFSAGNPATHPRLLARLSEEFVKSGFDIRHIERLILSSQAYQRSSRPAGNNSPDRHNLAHATVRPLMAEVLLDSINTALEASDDFGGDVPRGSQAIELAPNRFADRSVNDLFRVLGRGERKSFCDCDRAPGPSIRQPLFLMSDPRILEKIRGGRLERLMEQKPETGEIKEAGEIKKTGEIIDELYLATLSRGPDADEREFALSHVAAGEDRATALADIVWALINTREFMTNH